MSKKILNLSVLRIRS